MKVTKMNLHRRTFLRGAGTALALPFLDSMVPAFAQTSKSAANPLVRLGFLYVPNGIIEANWMPKTEGAGFEFNSSAKALEPFRDQTLFLSKLAQINGRSFGDGGADQRDEVQNAHDDRERPREGHAEDAQHDERRDGGDRRLDDRSADVVAHGHRDPVQRRLDLLRVGGAPQVDEINLNPDMRSQRGRPKDFDVLNRNDPHGISKQHQASLSFCGHRAA